MKKSILMLLALAVFAAITPAQGPQGVVAKRPKKPFIVRAVIASGACGLGIGLSANPATAAEIGIPILVGGNILAAKLYQKHPKWSAFVQTISPLGCFSYGHHAPPKVKAHGGGGNGGGNGGGTGGNGGNGGGSGSGGGTGSGGGSGSSGGGGSTGGSGGGNGGGGNGGGSNSGGGSGGGNGGGGNPPPPNGHCVQDCGFPGNGGVNGGNDGKKPPFPGKGRH